MKTIEPEIQKKILNILPHDGATALKLMAQLVANMVLSIDDADINSFISDVKISLAQYEGT